MGSKNALICLNLGSNRWFLNEWINMWRSFLPMTNCKQDVWLKKRPKGCFYPPPSFSRPLDRMVVCACVCAGMCMRVAHREGEETGLTHASWSPGWALTVLPCCDTAASAWWSLSSDGSSWWRLLWKRKNHCWGRVCLILGVWWEDEFDYIQMEGMRG